MTDTQRRNDPRYSVVKQGRWFYWAAWAGYAAMCDGVTLGDGRELTEAQAVAKAASCAGPNASRWPNGHVAHWRRQQAAKRRMAHATDTEGAAPLEFVYKFTYWVSDYGDDSRYWSRHRIVKRTRQYVFVDPRDFDNAPRLGRPTNTEWYDWDQAMHRLDRQQLETTGEAATGQGWSRRTYHAKPDEAQTIDRYARTPPAAIAALGLDYPCSAADVRRVYRQRSRVLHPDAGGAHEAFVELQRTYEAALVEVGDV